MTKYVWKFKKDDGWSDNEYGSIKECISEAMQVEDFMDSKLYIGIVEDFEIAVDASFLLEDIEGQVQELYDDPIEYVAYDRFKQEEVDELSEELAAVVKKWQEKYGYTPYFSKISYVIELEDWHREKN